MIFYERRLEKTKAKKLRINDLYSIDNNINILGNDC